MHQRQAGSQRWLGGLLEATVQLCSAWTPSVVAAMVAAAWLAISGVLCRYVVLNLGCPNTVLMLGHVHGGSRLHLACLRLCFWKGGIFLGGMLSSTYAMPAKPHDKAATQPNPLWLFVTTHHHPSWEEASFPKRRR